MESTQARCLTTTKWAMRYVQRDIGTLKTIWLTMFQEPVDIDRRTKAAIHNMSYEVTINSV